MRKFFKIFIFLLIVGILAYQFQSKFSFQFPPTLENFKNNFELIFSPTPCSKPIPYELGTFDTQFNISQNYFLNALAEAEAIWEKPFRKDLFAYVSADSISNALKINLIYDYRQQATSKLASLGIVVKNTRASYNMLKSKFTELKMKYEEDKNNFNEQAQTFNLKQQNYQEEVNFWNKQGGAPQNEYNKLQTARLELESELRQLQILQKNLNDTADEINALVVVLNRLASSLNLSVEKYNTTNDSRGESFEEGVYSINGSNREIDIYEFGSRAKLVRVLTHELGHALGLEHVDDPKAIMYKINQGDNQTLTTSDLSELEIKCGIKKPK